jgi:hypothetical protein
MSMTTQTPEQIAFLASSADATHCTPPEKFNDAIDFVIVELVP